MEQYTIFCSEEQTRKALELGAPINESPMIDIIRNEVGKQRLLSGSNVYWFPTAEQMTEWLLQEHDILCDVFPLDGCFDSTWFAFRIAKRDGKWIKFESNVKDYSTRKEAALAAIDDALEYLSQTKVSPN